MCGRLEGWGSNTAAVDPRRDGEEDLMLSEEKRLVRLNLVSFIVREWGLLRRVVEGGLEVRGMVVWEVGMKEKAEVRPRGRRREAAVDSFIVGCWCGESWCLLERDVCVHVSAIADVRMEVEVERRGEREVPPGDGAKRSKMNGFF